MYFIIKPTYITSYIPGVLLCILKRKKNKIELKRSKISGA